MQNLIATTFEVVHYIALQAVHYKPLQEVHLSRYNQLAFIISRIDFYFESGFKLINSYGRKHKHHLRADATKFGASPPSLTAKNPAVFSEHHHPKMLKTL